MKFFTVLLFILISISASSQSTADFIFYNGKIFTSDTNRLFVKAIAIKGEMIMATGTDEEILKLRSTLTKVANLEGRTVIPGFNDAHVHVGVKYPAYRFAFTQFPSEPTPWARIKDSIVSIVQRVPSGTLIMTNVDSDLFEDTRAGRRQLDSIAPDNPVMLSAWTGHGILCNSSALKLIGIDERKQFAGGNMPRYPDGKLNGLLEEYAGFRVSQTLAGKLPYEEIKSQVTKFYDDALGYGITTIQVMASSLPVNTFKKLYTENDFGVRNRIIAFPLTEEKNILYSQWKEMLGELNKNNEVSGIKLIFDGTPVERLAATTSPYSDATGKKGRINFSKEEIKKYLSECIRLNQQVIVHAVGDEAVNSLINGLLETGTAKEWKERRTRIEHGDLAVMNEQDIERIKSLGIVVVQNPTHFAIDKVMASRFNNRTKFLQAMNSLVTQNLPLAIGSDGAINPFLNLMFATIHPSNPTEALTIEQAVIAYTYGSAYAEFKEKIKGRLIPGQLADLAVLSQDIFSAPIQSLPATSSHLTIVGGRIVFNINKVEFE
jgi:predicted amidohydrolase YtcJ